MKKVNLLLVVLIGLFLGGCWTDVNPGQVGLRIWKRGNKAGEIEVLNVGRHDWAFRADDVFFPTYKQNYVWTRDSAEGSPNDESFTFPIEGLTINIDVGVEFSVIESQVGTIYSEYRQNLEGITDGAMRNYVRDSILMESKSYNSMEEFISNNEISTLIKAVEGNVREYFYKKGIDVSQIYLVNAPRYPETVIEAIEAKIKATQQAIQRENELREAEAEAKKKVAEAEGDAQSELARAKATAEANELLEKSLTDKIIKRLWIEKWNGELPQVSGNDNGLILNLTE